MVVRCVDTDVVRDGSEKQFGDEGREDFIFVVAAVTVKDARRTGSDCQARISHMQ